MTDIAPKSIKNLLYLLKQCSRLQNQNPNFESCKELKNRFQGINSASLCSLAGRYDKPMPTPFLAPVVCL